VDHVLNWLWQGLAIALVTFALLRALERSRAAARYGLCWVALVTILLLPIVAIWQAGLGAGGVFPAAALPQEAVVSVPRAWWTSVPVVVSLCALWFALFTVRISGALLKVRSARAACKPFPAPLESRLRYWTMVNLSGRRARLALSDGAGSACVLGCGAPVIAVSPALVQHLTAEELDRVVVHEWAHVQRRDDLVNLLQLAVRAVAGWHPAVWWLDRRLLLEREVACDETAVALTGSAKAYASSLTRVASLFPGRWARLASVGALSSPALSRRVVRILSRANRLSARGSVAAAAVAVLLLGAMSFSVGGLRLVGIAASSLRVEGMADTARAPIERPDAIEAESGHQRGGARERANGRVPDRAGERARSARAAAVQSQPAPPVPFEAPASTTGTPQAAGAAADERTGDVIPSTSLVSTLPGPVTAGTMLTQTASSPYAAAITQSSLDVRPVSPWEAAAGAGVAIGRTSQRAGVATATFFSRIGKKIGRSF